MIDATSGASVSIQSPHNDAVSLPYRSATMHTCTRTRIAAAAIADVRSLDILRHRSSVSPISERARVGPNICPRVYTDCWPTESSTWNATYENYGLICAARIDIRVNGALLWLHAFCQLFATLHLPTAPDVPSIHIESRPARLVMAGNRYLNQCRMNGSSTRTRIRGGVPRHSGRPKRCRGG